MVSRFSEVSADRRNSDCDTGLRANREKICARRRKTLFQICDRCQNNMKSLTSVEPTKRMSSTFNRSIRSSSSEFGTRPIPPSDLPTAPSSPGESFGHYCCGAFESGCLSDFEPASSAVAPDGVTASPSLAPGTGGVLSLPCWVCESVSRQ